MSKYVSAIPLEQIVRAELVEAKGRSMSQVKTAVGCDQIINCWFYNMSTGRPVGNLKIKGVVKANAGWSGYGLTWDAVADMRLALVPVQGGENYLSGVELLTPSRQEGAKLSYDAAYGGRRGRSAAMIAGETLVLYCSGDGTGDAKTPEALRDELAAIGRKYEPSGTLYATGWDSGGSSQCDFGGGQKITSSRKVAGYFCLWLEKDEQKGDKPVGRQYKVTPSVGINIRSGPGTGYSKVGAYACGTVVAVTAVQGGWGQTAKGWVSLEYLEAVEGAQRTTDTGMKIRTSYIDAGRKNRPGGVNPCRYITIHETGNKASGADAEAHGAYLNSSAGEADLVSWHYTVDDHAIVQHLPDGETAYHAGDGKAGTGNAQSIGIEICVNADGDFAKAKANAASLVRLLMEEHGVPIANVVQHNCWNGKDCPYTIRHTAGAWEAFLALCGGESAAETDRKTVQERFGLADETMDYLEAYKYGADLLKKLAGGK